MDWWPESRRIHRRRPGMAMHERHMMPGGKMMKGKMPATMPPPGMKPVIPAKPAVNPVLAKLPPQAVAHGVRGTVPPKRGGKK